MPKKLSRTLLAATRPASWKLQGRKILGAFLSRNARNRKLVADLLRTKPLDQAMEAAAGGNYEATGRSERHLLEQLGLESHSCVVDVGCGPGRLAYALRDLTPLSYFGFDIVHELVHYAAARCGRPDWTFRLTNGSTIPVVSGTADFVVFFSVFTHLPARAQLAYLREARRVARPGGSVVVSYLDETFPEHRSQAGTWLNRAIIRAHGHAPNYTTSRLALARLGRATGLACRFLEWSPIGQAICVFSK